MKEKTRAEQHGLRAACSESTSEGWKKGRLPLALDLAPGEAAACNLDHFGIFLFPLTELDAASRAVCSWLSCAHPRWKFKTNEQKCDISSIRDLLLLEGFNPFCEETQAPYLTLHGVPQHLSAIP